MAATPLKSLQAPSVRTFIALGLLLGACSGGSKDSTPTIPNTLTTVVVALSPASIPVGRTSTASASGLDQNGAPIGVGAVTWSSGSPGVATVNAGGVVSGVAAGQAQIIATSGTKQGQQTITVTPIPVATVAVTPAAATLGIGATQQLTATERDASGDTLAGRVVTWSTSDATKATVSASGIVTGVALGTATITATSETKTGTAAITVAIIPVASVTIAPPTAVLAVGGTSTMTATARDANGNVLTGRTFTWTTSNPAIVSGTATGNVVSLTAVSVGTDTVTATSEGKSGSAVVTVSGSVASVTLGTPGQSAVFLDSPNFNAALNVQPGSQYLIAVVNTDPSSTLREDFTLGASFGSSSGSRVLSAPVVRSPQAPVPSPRVRGPGIALSNRSFNGVASRLRMEQNHLAMLEGNQQIFARFGSPAAAWSKVRAQGGRVLPLSASVTQTIGSVNRVYVRNTLAGSCTTVDSIGARTVAVGQHVIVLADTNLTTWTQTYRPDSAFYQTFANEYDQITYPTLLAYIGNPLAYDASLSGIGKVTVVITPVLNNLGGLTGGGTVMAFVNGCDFYPYAASGANADFSNQTEMMYSMVPAANAFSVANWEKEIRATAAHESKHIVSYSDRILLGSGGGDEIWLEEGLAQISSEIWERHFNQATWKGHATFLQTVACEYALGAAAPCDQLNDRPLALLASHLPFTFAYLKNESDSNSEGLGLDTPANYGAGWTFARWAIDQYASTGEGPFIQSLINTTQTGLNNLSAHTGQSIPLLLTYWNVASAVFQTPTYTAADVRTTIPSFNFADIFKVAQAGLPGSSWVCNGTPCGFFTSTGLPVFPVQPIAFSSGPFSKAVTGVPGTSASYFLLSASAAGVETLQLLSGSGGVLSAGSGFRVAILRVQ